MMIMTRSRNNVKNKNKNKIDDDLHGTTQTNWKSIPN